MAPPKDIARSYPKRGLTADVGFRSEPKFCGDGAATFPTASDYAQTAASADLALGETYTVCAWVRHATSSSSTAMSILSSGSAEMTLSVFAGSNPALYVFNGSANMNTTGVFTIDLHTWYHVAIVIKSGGGNSQIFVNGIDRTASHPLTFPASGTPSINLGGYLTGGWQGDLANVALFTSSLTEDQVRQAMRASDYASHAAIATLEAFYPLSSDFNDSTGNHNATASGSPEFRPNRPQLPRGLDLARGAAQARVYTGRAVNLDGSADYLQTTLDSPLGTTFTVSSWVYRTSPVSGFDVIWETGTFGANAALRPAIKNTTEGLIDLNDNAGVAVSTKGVGLDRWAHVVICAIAGAGNTKIYVDGVDATPASHSVFVNATNALFEIGRYIGGAHYFKGYISDVRVFNSTLTADQVKELYHYPEQVLPTGVSASNLIHRWALSDYNDTGGTGGRYFQDSAGNNALEDKASASMTFAQPVPCPQLGLQQSASRISMQDTTNNTYYRSDVMSGTPFTNQGTLSGWFIMQELPGTTSGDYNPIFILGKYPGGDMLEIVYDNDSGHGTPNIWLSNGGGSIGVRYNHTFELGKLQHVVVTTLAASPYWQLWINGEKKTVSARSFSGSRTTWAFGDNKLSGGRWGDGPYGGVCHFIPVDTAAWNTVLSDSEVTQVYNSGIPGDVSGIASANLQAWWKCDDLTSFKDYSGNGVSGAVTVGSVAPGLASFPENASGSTIVGDFSMKRKGVSVLNCFNDPPAQGVRTEIPSGAGLQPSLTDGHTVSVWYRNQKQDTTSANNGTLVTSGDTGTPNRFVLETLDGNSFRGLYGSITATSTATISDNDWHHYVMVLDVTTSPNPTVRLYLDGVAAGTATSTIGTTFPESLTYIGWMNSTKTGFNYGLKGPLACPRIYAFQLSENEIKQIYNADYRLIRGLENE